MKTNLIIVLAIVAVLVVGGGIYFFTQYYSPSAGNEQSNNQAGTNSIEIKSFAFSPSTLTINVGDTITWTNKDIVSHTVTSDSGSELDSPALGKGKTYSHTFSTAGTFSYRCTLHPSMKGTIIVQ